MIWLQSGFNGSKFVVKLQIFILNQGHNLLGLGYKTVHNRLSFTAVLIIFSDHCRPDVIVIGLNDLLASVCNDAFGWGDDLASSSH